MSQVRALSRAQRRVTSFPAPAEDRRPGFTAPENLKVLSFAPNRRTLMAIGSADPPGVAAAARRTTGISFIDTSRHFRKDPGQPRFLRAPRRGRSAILASAGASPAALRHPGATRPPHGVTQPTRPESAVQALVRFLFTIRALDHKSPDISSATGLKWPSPSFVQPEAIGPEDQLRLRYSV